MNNKGLSSVVGAVLLITISVAAAVSAWSFINQVSQDTRDNIGEKVENEELESKSDLTMELVYNSTDGTGFAVARLRNTGSTAIPIQEEDGDRPVNLYIDGRPEDWAFTDPSKSGFVSLGTQQTIEINTTEPYPDENKEMFVEFNGPYETSTSYVCFNSGTNSC